MLLLFNLIQLVTIICYKITIDIKKNTFIYIKYLGDRNLRLKGKKIKSR